MVEQLSLIVCTRNRLSGFRPTLGMLLELRCRVPWQLIIVDNGSTDGTGEWVRAMTSSRSGWIDVLSEPSVGVSRAKNRGLSHARGEIIAFTDDDCYPTESYLNDLLDVFATPGVDYCGGRVLLHDPTDLPVTIKTSDTPEVFPAHSYIPTGAIHGANMAFTRRVVQAVGPFDVMFGPGALTRAAEDSDYLLRASWCGFTGMYSPKPTVRHHHKRKTQADYVSINRTYDFGRGAYYAKHMCARRTRHLMAQRWWWSVWLRSHEGRRKLLNEVRGATSYLWNARRRTVAGPDMAPEWLSSSSDRPDHSATASSPPENSG